MALILFRPLFWVFLFLQALFLLWLAWRLRLRWLPAWILRVAFIGALLLVLFSRAEAFRQDEIPVRQVMLVDLSDSVEVDARAQIRERARAWQTAAANRLVVAFGRDLHPVPGAEAPWPGIDGTASDLAGAIDLARSLLGSESGKVVLASDGLASDLEAAETAVSALAAAGHRLDVLPLTGVATRDDLYVGNLWVPSLLWEGGAFTAVLSVTSPRAAEVTVELLVNGERQLDKTASLSAGPNFLPLPVPAPPLGILTLEATVSLAGDPRESNNQIFATAEVFDSPRVLFITPNPAAGQVFRQALVNAGVVVDTRAPEQVSSALDALEKYGVIFLDNLPATSLTQEQMSALKVFVTRRGGGLIVLGGKDSYTLGGYKNTTLAPLLPVKLEPPPRMERRPVTFVIIFDRSGSMDSVQSDIPAISLAREAAMRAIEILNPEDYIGVLTYGSTVEWNVRVGRVSGGLALRHAQDAISEVNASGTTMMYEALSTAVADLEVQRPTEIGLILLLSDGESSDGSPAEFQALAHTARELGLRISTIILGEDGRAAALMALIAEEGAGRYHQALDASELPRIMIEEGKAARGDTVQEGITGLVAGEARHPVLAGINPAHLPVLRGYNALASRAEEGAEDILRSASFGDPVLSGWQYGLGRVLAWTGDSGEAWTSTWTGWSGSGAFWAQAVRYALLNPALGPAQVQVRPGREKLGVDVRLYSAVDQPLNWAVPEFIYADPSQTAHRFTVPQFEAGRYRLSIALPPAGAYRGLIRYQEDGKEIEVAAPFAVNYPEEWQPGDTAAARERLLAWATMTGGELVQQEAVIMSPAPAQPRVVTDALLLPLMWALIAYWPLEILLRRRWLPWDASPEKNR